MSSSESGTSKGFLGEVNDFLCSIKLSIVVLIALAATSIFGTVIQQGKDHATYVQEYGAGVARVIEVMNLSDMYHSWWFQILLGLLLVNITFCSIRRLPHAIRLMKDRDPVFDGRPVAIHERWETSLKGWTKERATEAVEGLLAAKMGRPITQEADGKLYFFVSRGAWSRMGVYITHFSLFLFAVGALIGVWTGLKGYVNIPEGTGVTQIELRDGKPYDLGFEVRCDDFEVSFYPDAQGNPTGRPKDYVSKLSVWENGRQVAQKTIEVNAPLIYKGIYFYQSSYGQGGASGARFSVYGPRRNVVVSGAQLAKGATVALENGDLLRLLDLTGDYRGMGPAVLVHVERPGQQPSDSVILQPSMPGPQLVGSYLVRADGVDTVMYTGLQVAKDPGVPVIWAGCILITIGTIVAFFFSHRRVWARVAAEGGGVRVTLAGNASRNRISFERWFEDLAESAKETFEK